MGQSVTIAAPSSWHLASFVSYFTAIAADETAVFSEFEGQLQVVSTHARWRLVLNEVSERASTASEYAENDDLDERFRQEAKALSFFVLRFDNADLVRRILRTLAADAAGRGESLWFDTDYGWVIAGADFLAEIRRNAKWDWRTIR